jgi:hypothetical protein
LKDAFNRSGCQALNQQARSLASEHEHASQGETEMQSSIEIYIYAKRQNCWRHDARVRSPEDLG